MTLSCSARPAQRASGDGGVSPNPVVRPRAAGIRSPLVAVLLLGLAVRVAIWLWLRHEPLHTWDELDYNRLAVNLATGGGFAFEANVPTSQRPPLYPAVVAAVYWLWGVEHFSVVRLLQAAVSLANVVLLHRLAAAIFCQRVALVAAGAIALYPSLLVFNHLLLTEVLFTVLLAAACHVSIQAMQTPSLPRAILAGALLGAAALTRSVLSPFAIVLSVLIFRRSPGSLGRRALAAGLLAAAFACIIAPWVVRNTRLERTLVGIDTMAGRTLMIGNYRHTPLERPWDFSAVPAERSWAVALAATYRVPANATRGEIDALAFRAGLRFMWEHPWLTLGRSIAKFVRFWGLERELIAGAARGYFGHLSSPAVLLLALTILGAYVGAMLTGIFGLLMAPPADRRAHELLLLVIGVICLVYTVTFGHSRYHLPVMPLMLLYSASACVHARDIWSRRRSPAFRWAVALCATLILGWLWELAVDADRYWPLLRGP